jgi:dihydroorotate dehydrogenase electron transfer subunit
MTVAAPAPPWRQVSGRVRRQAEVGADHLWLDLDTAAGFVLPAPGQFAQLLLPPLASSVLLPRPMSVASARRLGHGVTLGFLYAAVGAGTRALARLKPGDAVEVLGPLGHGFPLEHPGTPVLLAGGRGVAPLLFAAEALARSGRRCEFLFGARTRAQLVALDEATRRIARAGGRLHLSTDDGSRGVEGNVVALLERLFSRFAAPLVIHACGPHAMLKAIARWCEKRGVPAFLAMESVMACGTGVCRGCPLPRSAAGRAAFGADRSPLLGNRDYAMCCTEGPVFEAAALDWDRIE